MEISVKFIKENNYSGIRILNLKNKLIKSNNINLLVDSAVSMYVLKKNINKIIKLRKKLISLNKINIVIYNYFEENDVIKSFINTINIILKSNSLKEIYDNAYIEACNYLDSQFYGKNLCGFYNNKCEEKRSTNSEIGCCRHYNNKLLGPFLPR